MARVSSAVQVIDNILAYAHIDNHDTLDSYAQSIVFVDVVLAGGVGFPTMQHLRFLKYCIFGVGSGAGWLAAFSAR